MLHSELLFLLLFLAPGLLAVRIVDSLTVVKKHSDTMVLIRAGIYTVLVNGVLFALQRLRGYYFFPTADVDAVAFGPYTLLGVTGSFALAAMLAVLSSWLIGTDCHMKLLRRTGLTDLTSRTTTWLDVFREKGRSSWVVVNYVDGRRLYGWPEYYSSDPADEKHIFLTRAVWLNHDGSNTSVPEPGILVEYREDISSLQFVLRDQGKETHNE